MQSDGAITLYLVCDNQANAQGLWGKQGKSIRSHFNGKVVNWPSSIEFTADVKVGDHNLSGRRFDAWFKGPDGFVWHGVQYGENTQILHCKRTRKRAAH
ncbi:hypothetical protein [Nevskia ramosa]|uniref:hypothetical protein n=1 Tax=Nevskia ramosa TaxID=64002 RepID=UPI00235590C2|nr:hypothetical protein [Nevskia ramosa]